MRGMSLLCDQVVSRLAGMLPERQALQLYGASAAALAETLHATGEVGATQLLALADSAARKFSAPADAASLADALQGCLDRHEPLQPLWIEQKAHMQAIYAEKRRKVTCGCGCRLCDATGPGNVLGLYVTALRLQALPQGACQPGESSSGRISRPSSVQHGPEHGHSAVMRCTKMIDVMGRRVGAFNGASNAGCDSTASASACHS